METSDALQTSHRHPSFRILWVLLSILVLVIVGVLSGLVPRWHHQQQLYAEVQSKGLPRVSVVHAKPASGSSRPVLPAEVKPWVEAPIYARISGYLKQRFVDIGDHVQAGQLLAVIDAPEQALELTKARAQLEQAEAALGISRVTAARWAELLQVNGVSEQDAAEKQADFKLKTAQRDSVMEDVRRLEQIQAFTRITAPFSGTITQRNIDAGDLIVANGGKELFHLAQTTKLRVLVQVPQQMTKGVEIGQHAELTIPGQSGRKFPAKVIRTAGVILPDSRTLPVELELDNTKGEILAGSYAELRLSEMKTGNVLSLPANALLFRPEGPHVGVVENDGKVVLRKVQIGRDFGQSMEILSGVKPEDRVIVNPPDSLSTGALVSVTSENQPEKHPEKQADKQPRQQPERTS
uniref:Efflux RND transporter periplasmic adaptor subunit n=1 Tax=Desulfatirhabdium butyrativorans TaxID=340467 RepID=A0A7C4RGF8_9BACT